MKKRKAGRIVVTNLGRGPPQPAVSGRHPLHAGQGEGRRPSGAGGLDVASQTSRTNDIAPGTFATNIGGGRLKLRRSIRR